MELDLDNESDNQLVQEISAAIDKNAKDKIASIKMQMQAILLETRQIRAGFEERLFQKWQEGFDLFEIILIYARESGSEYNKRYSKQISKENRLTFKVLCDLHARACLIASEILALLRTGHPEGAHTRWRSLHEVAVVTSFIKEHRRDIALRYLEHEFVESLSIAKQYQLHHLKLGLEPLEPEEIPNLEAKVAALCTKYGENFKSEYGWAASALQPSNPKFIPKFDLIEKDVNLDHMRPYYKMASRGVHANPKGITHNLGNFETAKVRLAGPSNYGLTDPAHGSLISLIQCTASFLTIKNSPEALARIKMLLALSDEAGQTFLEIQRHIEQEERGNTTL